MIFERNERNSLWPKGREQCKMRQEKKEKFISFRALQVISILIISLRVGGT